jgi:hypothetical protein
MVEVRGSKNGAPESTEGTEKANSLSSSFPPFSSVLRFSIPYLATLTMSHVQVITSGHAL